MKKNNLSKDKQKREETLKSLQTSVSLNYMLPESRVELENNKLPRGPTNSHKCQKGFSNALCKRLFLLDRTSTQ